VHHDERETGGPADGQESKEDVPAKEQGGPGRDCDAATYSRSPQNPALQQFHKCSQSVSEVVQLFNSKSRTPKNTTVTQHVTVFSTRVAEYSPWCSRP